ncbi:MAG TPA: ABC transporter substrate-binding protein [Sphaerochaeta sp.]|nr:ABC transporter substrate-binding protein [Sphaerochaeta sp.]
MKRFSTVFVLLLASCFLFAQGIKPMPPADPAAVAATDANGRTLTISDPIDRLMIVGKAGNMPANILFLFPEVADMHLTLPKTDQGLGDFFALIDPALDAKSRISQQASVEEIATANADLVLMKATHYQSLATKLDQLQVPNYTVSLETWDEWQSELVEFGLLLQNPKRAEEILNLYREKLSFIKERVATVTEPKRLLLLQADRRDNTTSYKVAPDDWLQTWMVQTIGATAVWQGTNKAAAGWSTVSFEQIAAWDPDLIVLISYNTPTRSFLEGVYTSPIWADLAATQHRAILASPHDLMNYIQPVASWILGTTWLAKETYPELFSDIDMVEEVRSFYQNFYSITDERILGILTDAYSTSVEQNRQ